MINPITFALSFLPNDAVMRLRLIAFLTIGISIFALAFAYTAQYGFDLQPCILCLYQRWPYRIAIVLAALAFILARPAPGGARALLALCAVAFTICACIALYQVGIEERWWIGTEKCVGAPLSGLNADELLDKIKSAPIVKCDDVQFRFLGLTLAAYNGLFALGLAVGLVLGLRYKPARLERL